MKFLLVLLFSLSVSAGELKTCQEFVKTVLLPDVAHLTYTDDHGFRLSESESKALEFISKYDAAKLGIDLSRKNTKLATTECKYTEDKKFHERYCQSTLPNFNFLRALIHGMKYYRWSPKTVELGKQKLFEYFKTVDQEGLPLLEVAVAATLFHYYVSEFPSKTVKATETVNLKLDIENASDKLMEKLRTRKKHNCKYIQHSMKKEMKVSETFRKRLQETISKL